MTHANLVAKGAAWLKRQRCHLVLTEPAGPLDSHTERPDCLGLANGWPVGRQYMTKVIEVKVSRSDFRANARKRAEMGNFRWFLVPQGLVSPEEIPDGWGLLYCDGKDMTVVKQAPVHTEKDLESEFDLYITLLRKFTGYRPRIMGSGEIPGYNGKRDYEKVRMAGIRRFYGIEKD